MATAQECFQGILVGQCLVGQCASTLTPLGLISAEFSLSLDGKTLETLLSFASWGIVLINFVYSFIDSLRTSVEHDRKVSAIFN